MIHLDSVDSGELRDDVLKISAVVFDFDGVFTDNAVYVNEDGVESVRCSRSDGLGLKRLRALNVKMLIISTEQNKVVSARASKMNVECIQGVQDKALAIRKWAANNSITLLDVCYVGNDINDIPAFKEVGIPIGVADSYDEILPYIKYLTQKKGGYGAVREVCDLIAAVHAGQ